MVNKRSSLKRKQCDNKQKQRKRVTIFKKEWKKYEDSDKGTSTSSSSSSSDHIPILSSTTRKSIPVPPMIEFDEEAFRKAPQPVLTHVGPYDGALEIGTAGREQTMFPDHNPDPQENPKAPPEVPTQHQQNPFPLIDGNHKECEHYVSFPGANEDRTVNIYRGSLAGRTATQTLHTSTRQKDGDIVMVNPKLNAHGHNVFSDDEISVEMPIEYDANSISCPTSPDDSHNNIPDDDNNYVPFQAINYDSPTDVTKLEVNTSIFDNHLDFRMRYGRTGSKHQLASKVDKYHAHSLRLLKVMEMANTPHTYMPAFLEWAEHGFKDDVYGTGVTAPRRECTLKKAAQLFGVENWKPTNREITLPNCQKTLDVVTYDFLEMVKSLLTDSEVSQDANLLYDDTDLPGPNSQTLEDLEERIPNDYPNAPNCRWEDIDKKTHRLSDLNNGKWYHETYYLKCHGKKNHVLLPIILFADKTFADKRGNLCQEPVLFTLGIFNKATRQRPRAWRPLGFIPNLSLHNKHLKESYKKVDDYHRCLELILESLVNAQSHEGIKWDFCFKGRSRPVVLVPEVCFLMGDNEGQTKFCAMYQCRTKNVKCVCRHCQVPTHEIHKTYDSNKYAEQDRKEINKNIHKYLHHEHDESYAGRMEKKKAWDYLHEVSHHPVRNAFEKVSFGYFGVGNVNKACPGDIMHSNNEGSCHATIESIITCYRCNITEALKEAKARKKVKYKEALEKKKKALLHAQERAKELEKEVHPTVFDESNVEIKITETLSEQELNSYRVFTDTIRGQVDVMAKKWGFCLQHQSDKSIGRSHFVNGIFSQSKLAAHEVIGQLILFLLTLCSDYASQYFETAINPIKANKPVYDGGQKQWMGSDRLGDYIFAIEEELLTISLLKSPLTVEFVDQYRDYVPSSMFRIKKALNRTVGMGCNTLKFHLKVHRPENLMEYGDLNTIDTHVGEHSHTDTVKRPCDRSSHQARTLDVQSGLRNYENMVINKACQSEDVNAPYLWKQPKNEGIDDMMDCNDSLEGDIVTNKFVERNDNKKTCQGDKMYLHFEGSSTDRQGVTSKSFRFRDTKEKTVYKQGSFMEWHNKLLMDEVQQFFSNHIMPGIESDQDIFQKNLVRVAGKEFKADPCDNRHKNRNEGWHDWALVHLEGNAFSSVTVKESAMHVVMFFEIEDGNIQSIDKDLVQIKGKGLYALGHILATGRDPLVTNYQPVQPKSDKEVMETLDYDMWKRAKSDREKAQVEGTVHRRNKRQRAGNTYKPENVRPQDRARYERYCRGHAQSRLIMKGQKLCHNNAKDGVLHPRLCVIPVTSITGTTIAVPNLQHRLPPGTLRNMAKKDALELGESLDQSYLFIAGKDLWPGIMRRWVCNPT